ncbi:MAG: DUF2400 family protein [Bacteroidia bacterium]
MGPESLLAFRARLEALYATYHHRRYLDQDPVGLVWSYENLPDKEVAGLLSATFAFGRRTVARRKAAELLARLGPFPAQALCRLPRQKLKTLTLFHHRTWGPEALYALLMRLRHLYRKKDTLASYVRDASCGMQVAMRLWEKVFFAAGVGHLMGNPVESPAKRLHLFLRWLVRQDEIDPGGWDFLHPAVLYPPLDVHVSRWAYQEGIVASPTPSRRNLFHLRTFWSQLSPQDPLRYDFAIVNSFA